MSTAEIDTLGIKVALITSLVDGHICQNKSYGDCISDSLNSLIPFLIINIREMQFSLELNFRQWTEVNNKHRFEQWSPTSLKVKLPWLKLRKSVQ